MAGETVGGTECDGTPSGDIGTAGLVLQDEAVACLAGPEPGLQDVIFDLVGVGPKITVARGTVNHIDIPSPDKVVRAWIKHLEHHAGEVSGVEPGFERQHVALP